MISSDVIIVVVLAIFVIFVLNLNIVNAKKIRKNQAEAKFKKIDEDTKVEFESKLDDDTNYLHDYFNSELKEHETEKVVMQEVSETELKESEKEFDKPVHHLDKEFEQDTDNYNAASIVNDLDSYMEEDDSQKDYEIGIDDKEEEFTNELSEEFKQLSPEMKAFIMANVLKNKETDGDDNNKF